MVGDQLERKLFSSISVLIHTLTQTNVNGLDSDPDLFRVMIGQFSVTRSSLCSIGQNRQVQKSDGGSK